MDVSSTELYDRFLVNHNKLFYTYVLSIARKKINAITHFKTNEIKYIISSVIIKILYLYLVRRDRNKTTTT